MSQKVKRVCKWCGKEYEYGSKNLFFRIFIESIFNSERWRYKYCSQKCCYEDTGDKHCIQF